MEFDLKHFPMCHIHRRRRRCCLMVLSLFSSIVAIMTAWFGCSRAYVFVRMRIISNEKIETPHHKKDSLSLTDTMHSNVSPSLFHLIISQLSLIIILWFFLFLEKPLFSSAVFFPFFLSPPSLSSPSSACFFSINSCINGKKVFFCFSSSFCHRSHDGGIMVSQIVGNGSLLQLYIQTHTYSLISHKIFSMLFLECVFAKSCTMHITHFSERMYVHTYTSVYTIFKP